MNVCSATSGGGIQLRRAFVLALRALVVLLAVGPARLAQAAASLTFELRPERPVVGQPAELTVQTWEPDAAGKPDRTRPMDMTGYPFSVRAYRAEELPPGFAPESKGIAIDLEQVDTYTWRGQVSFPETGQWVIVFRNWYPSLTQALPPPEAPATLQVTVLPAERNGELEHLVGGGGVLAALLIVLALLATATALGSFLTRRRAKRTSG